jgi:TP53 regulating kinase-like protein
MLHLVGLELAKMHLADIIHGDLTTSNMMVRLLTEEQRRAGGGRENEVFEVVRFLLPPSLPSFLSANSLQPPVPASSSIMNTPCPPLPTPLSGPHRLRPLLLLPLLRRTRRRPLRPRTGFSSTHPVLPGTRPHFERVLEGYKQATLEAETGKKARRGTWEATEKRLEEVRGRGRKRSMVG